MENLVLFVHCVEKLTHRRVTYWSMLKVFIFQPCLSTTVNTVGKVSEQRKISMFTILNITEKSKLVIDTSIPFCRMSCRRQISWTAILINCKPRLDGSTPVLCVAKKMFRRPMLWIMLKMFSFPTYFHISASFVKNNSLQETVFMHTCQVITWSEIAHL